MIKTIFFDAAGTLIHLPKSVGFITRWSGNESVFHSTPQPSMKLSSFAGSRRPNVPPSTVRARMTTRAGGGNWSIRSSHRVAPETKDLDRDAFFEVAYSHFAEAGVWELYPDVIEVLEALRPRFELAVVSNFDGRLRMILEQLGVSQFFSHIFLSSELGADKPDPLIYQRALKLSGLAPDEVLHVGDDPVRDWQGAEAAGLSVFRLERPRNSLRDLLAELES